MPSKDPTVVGFGRARLRVALPKATRIPFTAIMSIASHVPIWSARRTSLKRSQTPMRERSLVMTEMDPVVPPRLIRISQRDDHRNGPAMDKEAEDD